MTKAIKKKKKFTSIFLFYTCKFIAFIEELFIFMVMFLHVIKKILILHCYLNKEMLRAFLLFNRKCEFERIFNLNLQ